MMVKEKRLVRTKNIVYKNRKISLEKEHRIAQEYYFTDKDKNLIASDHDVNPSQVWNISNKYKVVHKGYPVKRIEMEISEKDAEFVEFLLTEYGVNYQFKNLLIESEL